MSWAIEGRDRLGQWSVANVVACASGEVPFASEEDALAALENLVETTGWSREELRVREVL